MKKKPIIIVTIVLIILCIIGIILFLNNGKSKKDTGAFYNTNFDINGYNIEISSKESGHPVSDSYFNTSFNITDSKKYIHSYEVDIIDLYEIDKKDVKVDGSLVTINKKKYYYSIDNDTNTAIMEHYTKVSGKRIVLKVKVTGMSVFDYMGNLTSEMSKIDDKVLSSEELASILNISLSKVKDEK